MVKRYSKGPKKNSLNASYCTMPSAEREREKKTTKKERAEIDIMEKEEKCDIPSPCVRLTGV